MSAETPQFPEVVRKDISTIASLLRESYPVLENLDGCLKEQIEAIRHGQKQLIALGVAGVSFIVSPLAGGVMFTEVIHQEILEFKHHRRGSIALEQAAEAAKRLEEKSKELFTESGK